MVLIFCAYGILEGVPFRVNAIVGVEVVAVEGVVEGICEREVVVRFVTEGAVSVPLPLEVVEVDLSVGVLFCLVVVAAGRPIEFAVKEERRPFPVCPCLKLGEEILVLARLFVLFGVV